MTDAAPLMWVYCRGPGSGITGYSIISADNLNQTAELAKGCPIIADGGVMYIYETFDVM